MSRWPSGVKANGPNRSSSGRSAGVVSRPVARSHVRRRPSGTLARTVRLSGLTANSLTIPAGRTRSSRPVAVSQQRMVRSQPAVTAILPSGLRTDRNTPP